LVNSKINEGT